MSRAKRLFQALNLVEKDATAPAPVYQPEEDYSAPVAEAAPPVTLSQDDTLTLVEGASLTDIYSNAGIVSGHFSFEKLSEILSGLSQLDVNTRRLTIDVMDKADSTWDIDTVLAEGQVKANALRNYKSQVAELRRAIGQEVERRLAASQAEKSTTLGDIDRQIAELQTTREKVLSDTATLTATLRGSDLAAEEAAGRENARLDDAIKQITTLISIFPADAANDATPNNTNN